MIRNPRYDKQRNVVQEGGGDFIPLLGSGNVHFAIKQGGPTILQLKDQTFWVLGVPRGNLKRSIWLYHSTSISSGVNHLAKLFFKRAAMEVLALPVQRNSGASGQSNLSFIQHAGCLGLNTTTFPNAMFCTDVSGAVTGWVRPIELTVDCDQIGLVVVQTGLADGITGFTSLAVLSANG